MKIQTVDAGVWWIAIADEIRPREGLTWQKLFETVQKEFKFAEVPTQLPQGNRGYEFKQGSLEDAEGTIVITLLAVYNDGINVAVPSDTRKAEKALQAAMDVFY